VNHIFWAGPSTSTAARTNTCPRYLVTLIHTVPCTNEPSHQRITYMNRVALHHSTVPLGHDICNALYSLREYAPGSQHISRPRWLDAPVQGAPDNWHCARWCTNWRPPKKCHFDAAIQSALIVIECNGVSGERQTRMPISQCVAHNFFGLTITFRRATYFLNQVCNWIIYCVMNFAFKTNNFKWWWFNFKNYQD
jgi:hypothetical protein